MRKFSNLINIRCQPLFLLVLCSMMFGSLSAQRLTANRGTVKNAYNFWFYVPSAEPQTGAITVPPVVMDTIVGEDSDLREAEVRKPLVIFLHGASLCGRNLSMVRRYGTIDALTRGLKLDAYVLAPQNPGGAWNPKKINNIVDWALKRYAIDSTRIYVLGMSLGGYGTINYAADSPNRVAAAMALCGGGTSKTMQNLLEVPLCILHGTADRAVSWKASQYVVDKMLAAGDTTRLIYRLLPNQSHGALARYFYTKEVYDWLFQHSLADEGRPVDRRYNFGIEITHNVYRALEKPSDLVVEDTQAGSTREEDLSPSSGVHIVRKGDSLSRIAKKHRTTVAKLCRLNNLSRTSTLQIGQKIRY